MNDLYTMVLKISYLWEQGIMHGQVMALEKGTRITSETNASN